MVFHITTRQAWEQAQNDGIYTADSLKTEGFIHFSTADQVVATANRFYHGLPELVLLMVDPSLLQAELLYEEGEPGEFFPHLYGSLNLDAVTQTIDFPPDQNGGFSLPAELKQNPTLHFNEEV